MSNTKVIPLIPADDLTNVIRQWGKIASDILPTMDYVLKRRCSSWAMVDAFAYNRAPFCTAFLTTAVPLLNGFFMEYNEYLAKENKQDPRGVFGVDKQQQALNAFSLLVENSRINV